MTKRSIHIIIFLIMIVGLLGFSITRLSKEQIGIDREGNSFKLPKQTQRIVSTAPSNTEILVALGLGDKIVVADNYSKGILPVESKTTYIDFLNPDAEKIIEINPDIIIASGQNKLGTADTSFELFKQMGIPVVYIPSSSSIESIYEDILFIGEITRRKSQAEKIVSEMKKEIQYYEEIGNSKKRIYFEIAPAPTLYSFGQGTFLNEMIEILGAENILNQKYGWVSPSSESIIEMNPDIIFTNVNYIEDPIGEIKKRAGWDSITAVKNNAIYQIDTNASSRPSQYIIKALKQMENAIYGNEK